MDVLIRRAEPSDASAVCNIVRRSMVELCVADHRLEDAVESLRCCMLLPRRIAGISKALLATLEREAIDADIKGISLESSMTAQRFYQRCGYVSAGDPVAGFGMTKGYPITKRIAP